MADANSSSPGEPPPDYETVTAHRHVILATAIEAGQGRPVPVTLHHWSPPSLPARITVVMSPGALSIIKDFQSLGTFGLPDAVRFELSRPLSKLLAAAEIPPGTEPTPQLLADLVSQLAGSDQHQGASTRVQFFSFPVFSNSPTEIYGHGFRPMWKWAKPDSAYWRKTGSWKATIQEALDDGEWNAGKGLKLFVRGEPELTP
ncbi:hypothetical protein VTK26DRAFT_1534 [Humicola hyalothermophila]